MALRHEARGERGNVWQGVGTRAIPKNKKNKRLECLFGQKKSRFWASGMKGWKSFGFRRRFVAARVGRG